MLSQTVVLTLLSHRRIFKIITFKANNDCVLIIEAKEPLPNIITKGKGSISR